MREAFDKTQIQVLVLLTLVNFMNFVDRFWSVATFLTGLVHSFRGLLGARAQGMLRDCPRVASPCSPSTP